MAKRTKLGRPGSAPPPPRFWPEPRRSGLRRLLFGARPFLLLAVAIAVWPLADRRLIPAVGPLAGEPERVDRRFTDCGPGRGFACVIDGDTFRLGDRKIRIKDINAPELASPECPAERLLAEQSKRRLRELLNEGPFVMTASRIDLADRYGRELRLIERVLPGGETESIGDAMREAGMAHAYLGALEPGWC